MQSPLGTRSNATHGHCSIPIPRWRQTLNRPRIRSLMPAEHEMQLYTTSPLQTNRPFPLGLTGRETSFPVEILTPARNQFPFFGKQVSQRNLIDKTLT